MQLAGLAQCVPALRAEPLLNRPAPGTHAAHVRLRLRCRATPQRRNPFGAMLASLAVPVRRHSSSPLCRFGRLADELLLHLLMGALLPILLPILLLPILLPSYCCASCCHILGH